MMKALSKLIASRGHEVLPGAEPALHMARGRLGIVLQQLRRRRAGRLDQIDVALEVGEAQQRRAALALAEEFAGAALLQIVARDLEAVGVLVDDLQAGSRRLRSALVEKKNAHAVA